MKVEIKIDENQKEPKIILVTDKITDEIRDLAKRISDINSATIVGYKDEKAEMISFDEIINIYASSAKVFAETSTNKYILKMKLYEIEKQFAGSNFIRISYSEIINMNKVQNFDLSKAGTICVKMTNGESLYVSRRNVQKIKKYLGIWGDKMKKEILIKTLVGFWGGVALLFVVIMFYSLIFGFIPSFYFENSLVLECLIIGFMGLIISLSTFLWEIKNWNIVKQTLANLLVITIFMIPKIIMVCREGYSVIGFISVFMIYILVFFVSYKLQYFTFKNEVKKMNAKLSGEKIPFKFSADLIIKRLILVLVCFVPFAVLYVITEMFLQDVYLFEWIVDNNFLYLWVLTSFFAVFGKKIIVISVSYLSILVIPIISFIDEYYIALRKSQITADMTGEELYYIYYHSGAYVWIISVIVLIILSCIISFVFKKYKIN